MNKHKENVHERKNSIRIGSLNIGSGLFKKEELLMNTILEEKCDIFGVSEVDIQFFYEQKPFSFKGYETFFSLEIPGTITKRLLCFVKENVEVKERKDLTSNLLSNVWLKITGTPQKILICLMYREFSDLTTKGQMSINEQVERMKIFQAQVENATKQGMCVIMGDMSINLEQWEDSSYYLKKEAEQYQSMIGECGLEALDYGITWCRNHKNGKILKSAIDHTLTNKIASIKNYFKTGISYSDHSLICVDINVNTVNP